MRHKHPHRCTAIIAVSYHERGRRGVVRKNHRESKIGKEFALDKYMTKRQSKKFQKLELRSKFYDGSKESNPNELKTSASSGKGEAPNDLLFRFRML